MQWRAFLLTRTPRLRFDGDTVAKKRPAGTVRKTKAKHAARTAAQKAKAKQAARTAAEKAKAMEPRPLSPGVEFFITIAAHHGWVGCVAFDPSGRIMASGGNDAKIKLWDASSGQHLRTL